MDRNNAALMRRGLLAGVFALPILFLAIFYLYPLWAIFRVSFGGQIGANTDTIWKQLITSYFWEVAWFTTWQAALSTLLTLALGLPLAYVFASFRFPGKALLRALLTIPFVMPAVVVAVAFSALIGRGGLLNQWLQRLLMLDSPPIQLEQTIWLILDGPCLLQRERDYPYGGRLLG